MIFPNIWKNTYKTFQTNQKKIDKSSVEIQLHLYVRTTIQHRKSSERKHKKNICLMDMNFTHQQRLANGQCQIPYKKQFSSIYICIYGEHSFTSSCYFLMFTNLFTPYLQVLRFLLTIPIHIINPKSPNSFSYVQGTAPCQVPQ